MPRSKSALIVLSLPLLALTSQASPDEPKQEAPAGVNCISPERVLSRRPMRPNSVRFEMADGTVYRSEAVGACPRLERANEMDIIAIEMGGNQLCSGDRFRVVDPAQGGGFPTCRLGRFVPVDER